MNIYSYDPIGMRIDYSKTYIDYKKGILYSKEMKLKKYFFVATKYNQKYNITSIFIVFTDTKPIDNRIYGIASLDKCMRFRTSLKSLIIKYNITPTTSDIENIDISIDDEDEDGIAYKILEC